MHAKFSLSRIPPSFLPSPHCNLDFRSLSFLACEFWQTNSVGRSNLNVAAYLFPSSFFDPVFFPPARPLNPPISEPRTPPSSCCMATPSLRTSCMPRLNQRGGRSVGRETSNKLDPSTSSSLLMRLTWQSNQGYHDLTLWQKDILKFKT